jgi:hypothetical protein
MGLLFASYSTFSWFLYKETVNWLIWAIVILFACLQALLLTTLADSLKSVIDTWLQSDLGYFTSVIIGALLLAFIFVWANLFGYILVIFASEALARLDLQTLGCNRFQSLVFLTSFSLLGIALGQFISRII